MKTLKRTKMIVPIKKGHLVIPVMKGNFELVDTITINIDKKDIDKLYNMINPAKFKNLKNVVKNKIFVMWAINEFPDLIYNKIKTDFPEFFDDGSLLSGGLFRIDMIEIYNDEIEVHLDYLKRVHHATIKQNDKTNKQRKIKGSV